MKLDQHFLVDKKIAEFMVNSSAISKKDSVLEIGPGKGALTQFLVKKTKNLTLIETDPELEESLKKFKADLIIGNALENLKSFDKLVSSLPYSICEPLLWKLIRIKFKSAILLVPKKFYEKLAGLQESKLAILSSEMFNVELLKSVKSISFSPEPDIDSCVIKITLKETSSLLKEIFLQYDKKLKNVLENILTKQGKTKKHVKALLKDKLNPKLMNEVISHLSLEQLKELKNLVFT